MLDEQSTDFKKDGPRLDSFRRCDANVGSCNKEARMSLPRSWSFAAASWPMSCGLQVEAGGSAVRWNALADLTGWLVLHFTFESAQYTSAAHQAMLAQLHESQGQLLEQFSDEAFLLEFEDGVRVAARLRQTHRGHERHCRLHRQLPQQPAAVLQTGQLATQCFLAKICNQTTYRTPE